MFGIALGIFVAGIATGYSYGLGLISQQPPLPACCSELALHFRNGNDWVLLVFFTDNNLFWLLFIFLTVGRRTNKLFNLPPPMKITDGC